MVKSTSDDFSRDDFFPPVVLFMPKIPLQITLLPIPGAKRRGLEPRNDVLTTCKAVTLPCGQRMIALFPTVFLEARSQQEANRQRKSEMLKKLKKIISCIFVFLAYRICLSVLKLQGKLKRSHV